VPQTLNSEKIKMEQISLIKKSFCNVDDFLKKNYKDLIKYVIESDF